MKRILLSRLLLCAFLLGISSAFSEEYVFKFSEPSQINSWRIASQILEPLALTKRFATGKGGYSFRFATPAWRGDMPEWPSCESVPEVKDWSGFDRLVLDVTNTGKALQSISFFTSDPKVPFRKGFYGRCGVEGLRSKRFVFELKKIPESVDRRNMSIFHIFTERPGENMEMLIGAIYLLRPGEQFPAYPKQFAMDLQELYKTMQLNSGAAVDAAIKKLAAYEKIPALQKYLSRVKAQFNASLGNYKSLLQKADITVEELQDLRKFMTDINIKCGRMESDVLFLKKALDAGQDISQMVVGTASTMLKVMPRDVPCDIDVDKALKISLARNEREGVQVVVKAVHGDLKDVDVSISPLKKAWWCWKELKGVEIDVVGYVQTLARPPYVVKYVGWWPDPLLRNKGYQAGVNQCGKVTVKAGDMQSFWLRFHTTKNEAAGVYHGKVTVTAKGVKPFVIPISVQVYPFCLPDNTPLPTAISFSPPKKQMTQKEPYDKMKFVYADFLSDYKIDSSQLYSGGAPEWDVLSYLHKKGRLTAFNLGYFGLNEKNFDEQMPRLLKRFKPHYEKAKELGLVNYAYLYGFDEAGKDMFPVVERCYAELRKAFPEVLTMTTTYDNSYGTDSVIKSVQAWCPLTPRFDVKTVEKARQSGRWVWWYICCGPHNPYTNWFIEYAAIESRLVMGAQSVKFRPDGFLYYALTIWNDNMGIDCGQGPFTTWNPVSWTVYHGDGSLFYCDKNGYPLPSIRLENYRDGQEDYAYAIILEAAIKRMKAKGKLTRADKAWLAEAEAAVVVPEGLVVSMKEYSHDPKVLLAWRNRMADVISKSGMEDLNPWKTGFGVRGWRK